MSIIKLQQAYADQILAMIERLDPFAIIAGGAPRDWYLEREATDLDVYFHPNPNWDKHTLKEQLKVVGFNLDGGGNYEDFQYEDFQANKSKYGKNEYIKSMYNPNNTAMKVQLMAMSEPTFKSVLPKFPLNLCLAWYKNCKVHTETLFELGVSEKVIICTNSDYLNNDPYIIKIVDRFPEYKYFVNEAAYFQALKQAKEELNALHPHLSAAIDNNYPNF
jgi:hypothetical protein